jgi:hypothetical protein
VNAMSSLINVVFGLYSSTVIRTLRGGCVDLNIFL